MNDKQLAFCEIIEDKNERLDELIASCISLGFTKNGDHPFLNRKFGEKTPLTLSIERNHVEVIKFLLNFQCLDINAGEPTPLLACIKKNNFKLFREIIETRGLEVELNKETEKTWTPLYAAVMFNRVEFVKYLLAQKRVNYAASAISPLYNACLTGSIQVLLILLQNGKKIDINKKNRNFGNSYNETALFGAIKCKHEDENVRRRTLEFLLRYSNKCGNAKLDITHKWENKTASMLALEIETKKNNKKAGEEIRDFIELYNFENTFRVCKFLRSTDVFLNKKISNMKKGVTEFERIVQTKENLQKLVCDVIEKLEEFFTLHLSDFFKFFFLKNMERHFDDLIMSMKKIKKKKNVYPAFQQTIKLCFGDDQNGIITRGNLERSFKRIFQRGLIIKSFVVEKKEDITEFHKEWQSSFIKFFKQVYSTKLKDRWTRSIRVYLLSSDDNIQSSSQTQFYPKKELRRGIGENYPCLYEEAYDFLEKEKIFNSINLGVLFDLRVEIDTIVSQMRYNTQYVKTCLQKSASINNIWSGDYKLGSGAFATVYAIQIEDPEHFRDPQVQGKREKQLRALKMVKRAQFGKDKTQKEIEREMKNEMKKRFLLNHKYVIETIGFFCETQSNKQQKTNKSFKDDPNDDDNEEEEEEEEDNSERTVAGFVMSLANNKTLSDYFIKSQSSFSQKASNISTGSWERQNFKTQSNIPHSFEIKLKLLIQLAEGLVAIHRNNLVHRDIKLKNIGLHIPSKKSSRKHVLEENVDLQVKIFDLGGLKLMSDTINNTVKLVGTPFYASPEIFKIEQVIQNNHQGGSGTFGNSFKMNMGKRRNRKHQGQVENAYKISNKCDVFSFATCGFIIMFGLTFRELEKYFYKQENYYEILRDDWEVKYPKYDNMDEREKNVIDLLKRCHSNNPEYRPDMKSVVDVLKCEITNFK